MINNTALAKINKYFGNNVRIPVTNQDTIEKILVILFVQENEGKN